MRDRTPLPLLLLLLALLVAGATTRIAAASSPITSQSEPLRVHLDFSQLSNDVDDSSRALLEDAFGIVTEYLARAVTVLRPGRRTATTNNNILITPPCSQRLSWSSGENECVARAPPPTCGEATTDPNLYGGGEVCRCVA